MNATNEQRTRLNRLSNIGVRYIFGVRKDAHITPYWKRLGWLRSDSRRLYYTALLLYKMRRMREPNYLADFFKEHNPWPTSWGFSRNSYFLLCPTKRVKDPFKFRVRGSGTLFPPSLRHIPSYGTFKRAVRQYLLDRDSYQNISILTLSLLRRELRDLTHSQH